MPYLGDYLGQLLAELAMARAQADLETVRLAELYASHPLLRTMPVPHVRLPEVELDLPVLVAETESPRPGESTRGGVTATDVGRTFHDLLARQLTRAGVKLSGAELGTVRAAVDERLGRPDIPAEISVDVHRVADDLSAAALRALEALPRATGTAARPIPPSLAAELKESARLELLRVRTAPPRLTVLVTSSELREGATTENVTRLRLKISEQGLEWATVESEGRQQDQLVPE